MSNRQVADGSECTDAGIDWASARRTRWRWWTATGCSVERFTVAHTATGLRQLVRRLRRAGVDEVAIERPDGPVVDALLEAGLSVFVIAPNQLKNLRSRYGSAGNKDDRFDAFVLADTLRTDRARLRPLTRDCEATVTPADDGAGPQGPRRRPGRDGQPAARPPADHAARSDRAVP